MASYESPTIIQPTIPLTDMTPLEQLLLGEIFTAEPDGEGLYFFAESTTNDMPECDVEDLRDALAASVDATSEANAFVRGALGAARADDQTLTLDMSIISWECLFQDIVRRSSSLTYITAISAFTCSKMRVDGFGGLAVLITEKQIQGKSLDDVLNDFIDHARACGEIPEDAS